MELTERLAATLGHVYESSRHRSTVGHHPASVKEELVAGGMMKQVRWKKHVGPVFEVTPRRPRGLSEVREGETRMSTRDNFERCYGGIPVTGSPYVDSITMIVKDRPLSAEENARMREITGELKRLAANHPVTMEGVRDLHRHRQLPMHNIPMPRTEEGDRFRLVIHKMRKETWPGLFEFGNFDYAALERRLVYAAERASWTLEDCYWRDGEE